MKDKYTPIKIDEKWFIECWFYLKPPQYLYEGKIGTYLVSTEDKPLSFNNKEKAVQWCEAEILLKTICKKIAR